MNGIGTRTPLALLTLLLVYVGLWLVLTPYDGMNHDAQGYAIQAIAVSDPEPLSRDLFLLYRSQEEFSVFPQAYAFFVDKLGLETAAAALTFSMQILWYVAAFLLLRHLLGARFALFGIGLLVTMPAAYGGLRIFHLAEPFLTGRLPAEVLSLGALWLWLSGRRMPAAVLLVAGIAIHPLITFPAGLALAMVGVARPGRLWMLPAVVGAGCVLAILGSYVIGGDAPAMDGRWLAVTQMRSRFLFVNQWHWWDWNHTLQTLLTVLLGWYALRSSDTGRLLLVTFWLSLAGLSLCVFYSLAVHLEVLIQGQPWRWHWPARFLAIGALPAIVWTLWGQGGLKRAAALFLVSSWAFVAPLSSRAVGVTMMGALLAGVALGLAFADSRATDEVRRLGVKGGAAVLLVVLTTCVVTCALVWFMADSANLTGQGFQAKVANVLRLIAPSVAIAMLCAALALIRWTPVRGAVVAAVGLLLIAIAAPSAVRAWTDQRWTGSASQEFADWRELIPRDAEVLWWERPREIWFLLQRRSYLSRSQSGGIVFSGDLADEIARRALVLEPLIVPEFWLGVQARTDTAPAALTPERLAAICRDPELGFVVWDADLGTGAPRKHWPTARDTIYLYDCAQFRGATTHASP